VTSTINGVQIQNGNATARGEGGGIANLGAELTLNKDTITGNTVAGGLGGGIYNDSTNHSTMNVFRSTISDNSAPNNNTSTGASPPSGQGGGIDDGGDGMVITNSTIFGNTAGQGGGIQFSGQATVLNTTIDGNSAVTQPLNTGGSSGGGVESSGGNNSTVSIGDSIVAKNAVTNGTPPATSPSDCVGSVFTLGNNMIGVLGCHFNIGFSNDQVGSAASPADPLLGGLQDNGGPTLTQVPGGGSGAIDGGSNTWCAYGR
jgi:hypothetical protein